MVRTADEIRRINGNGDLKTLNLVLSEDSDFEEITEAISEIGTVKRIVISCLDEDEPFWGLGALMDLFEAVGRLPKLQSVKIKHVGYEEENPFTITLLTCLLNESLHQLQMLHLQDTGLLDSETEFRQFGEALKVQTHLKRFKVDECSLADDPPDSCRAMNHIVKALSFLPHIKDVALKVEEEEGELGGLEGTALEKLCQSRTLEYLDLDGFELNDDCLVTMAHALQTSISIKKLSMDIYGNTVKGYSAIVEMIQLNESLEQIRLEAAPDFEAQTLFLAALAGALTCNKSIRDARFYGFNEITDGHELAFGHMLETNDVLQTLILSGESENFEGPGRPKIDFYLRLNKRGRRHLTEGYESAGREKWVQVIADCSLDLDCMFYFLRMNPMLCTIPDSDNDSKSSILPKLKKYKTSEELRQIHRDLAQAKVNCIKQNQTLKQQMWALEKKLDKQNQLIDDITRTNLGDLAQKDVEHEAKLQSLTGEVKRLRAKVLELETVMKQSQADRKDKNVVTKGKDAVARVNPQFSGPCAVLARVNPQLPGPLKEFWRDYRDGCENQFPLQKLLQIGGNYTTNVALEQLGLNSKYCGHYFIMGKCIKRNCRKNHSHPSKSCYDNYFALLEALERGLSSLENTR